MLPHSYNFGETPFKNKTDIHDELIADLGKVITNDGYLQKCEIQVLQNNIFVTFSLLSLYKIKRFFYDKKNYRKRLMLSANGCVQHLEKVFID